MKKLLITLGIIGTAASTYVVTNAAIKGGSVKGVMRGLSGSLRSTISFLLRLADSRQPGVHPPAADLHRAGRRARQRREPGRQYVGLNHLAAVVPTPWHDSSHTPPKRTIESTSLSVRRSPFGGSFRFITLVTTLTNKQ
jgi:hypothetical protein